MFAEYTKKSALTNQPPSGREGDHGSGGRSPRNYIKLHTLESANNLISLLLDYLRMFAYLNNYPLAGFVLFDLPK